MSAQVIPLSPLDQQPATGPVDPAEQQAAHNDNIVNPPNNGPIKKGFLTKLFSRQTLEGVKKQFTLQAVGTAALGAGVSFGTKALCVSALGCVSFPPAGIIIVSAVAAGVLSAGIKIVAGHLYTKYYLGEEVEAPSAKKVLKAMAVQSLFGAAGSTAYVFSDQILGALSSIAKPFMPDMPDLTRVVSGASTYIGGLFTKLKDMFEPSAPAPVSAQTSGPVAAAPLHNLTEFPSAAADPLHVLTEFPSEQVADFDASVAIRDLTPPTFDNAIPEADAPSPVVAANEFMAKMPILPLPDDLSLPHIPTLEDALGAPEIHELAKVEILPLKSLEAAVPAPDVLFEPRPVEIPLAKLEDIAPPSAPEDMPEVVITPSTMDRLEALMQQQKNVSPQVKASLIAARNGDAQAIGNFGYWLFNSRGGLPLDQKLAVELFQMSADKGNLLSKVNYAYALKYGFGVEANPESALALVQSIADKSSAAKEFANVWTSQTPVATQPPVVQQASVPKNVAPVALRPSPAIPAAPVTPAATQAFTPSVTPVVPSVAPSAAIAPKMQCEIILNNKGGGMICTGEGTPPFKVGQRIEVPALGLLSASPR